MTDSPDDTTPPATVMQLLPALDGGGVERGTVDMARALRDAGWNAVVVSAGGRMVRELDQAGATHLTLSVGSKNPLTWRRTLARLIESVRRHDVDVIHARSRMPAWIGLRAARVCGVPFVTTFHGRYGDTNAVKKIYNSVMCRGDRVIAISDHGAAEIRRRYGVDAPRLRTIHRGVDLDVWDLRHVSGPRVAALAARWNMPSGVPVIMLPARVTRWKGHGLLIEALAQLTSLRWHCILVGGHGGKHAYRKALDERIEALGLGARVQFTGHCDDMPAACGLADVVVSASLDPEPFGRVVVEARAMGRRVVAGNHGGAAEILAGDPGGVLVDPGSAAALAEGLGNALGAAARLGSVVPAPERTLRTYSTATMCGRTLALYRELLDERDGGA